MPRKATTNRQALPKVKGNYVYCYLRTDSPRPYYVGKGARRDRMTAKHSCNVPSDWSRIRILRQGLTPEEADRWEIFYIERLGRKCDGGILVNVREGGDGGAQDPETCARIGAKVAELHAQGVFAKLNTFETAARRAHSRAANKAAEYGIPEQAYLEMSKSDRDYCKRWLDANEGATYEGWLASRKSAVAAAKYGLTEAEWLGLDRKQRNCLKEWMLRWPGRNPHDWLAGKRAQPGSKPRIDKTAVLELLVEGLSQKAVATRLGCHPSVVSRIANGKRQAAVA